MSLDQNLFTLAIAGSTEEPGALDLTDPNTGTIHYRKRMNPPTAENGYTFSLYDPLSDSLLCTITAPNSAAKQKWIELHNPEAKVEMNFTGSFTFKWAFAWEEHTFEWRRESCYLIRKPDPPVQVAVTREPAGRIRTSQVQLLDYNLNRFDINDRKGLEIVMLGALLSFRDQADDLRSGGDAVSPTSAPPSRHNSDGPPAVPTKSAAEVVSALQSINKVQQNVVIVGDQGHPEDYAKHCVDMLKDESMLYIVIRPQSSEHVAKVIQVAEATKRFYYKSVRHDEDLHQYVSMEDAQPVNTGPKVINLDDGGKKKGKPYIPPQTVTVHLSKIAMPELQPKAKQPSPKAANAVPSSSSSPNNKPAKSSGRTGRDQEPSRPPAGSSHPSSSSSNKLSKPQQQQPARDPSPNPYRYPMALYPPTGPPPSFGNNNNQQKPHKGHKKEDSKDERRRRQEQQQQQQQQPQQQRPYSMMPAANPYPNNQMPGSWPNNTPPAGGGGAMNANANYRPPSAPQPNTLYQGYNNTPTYGSSGNSTPGRYGGGPPTGPPPTGYPGQPQPSSQQQQPNSSGGLGTTLTNGIATVGYSLLDKLTHKQNPSPTPGR
ncbi:hypothetical protein CPB86DRAFT_783253 [Serendipita vermifera]|nr:hypothetical protein CPB86DRAFT_783253 [Serendipita vermifera]